MIKKLCGAGVGVHYHFTTSVGLNSPLGYIPIVIVLRVAVDLTIAVKLVTLIDKSLLVVKG